MLKQGLYNNWEYLSTGKCHYASLKPVWNASLIAMAFKQQHVHGRQGTP